MDSMNFEWLENDKAIIDTLVASSTTQPDGSNVSNDILQYLLQTDNNTTAPPLSFQQPTPPPPTQEKTENHVTEKASAPAACTTAVSTFRSTVSVVQSKDNFVTFMPLNAPTKKSTAPKKTKFKEPIFVTESPQDAYKKKKKSNNSASQSPSSGEDNSDDDMLLDEELGASTSSSKLKQMTSKERRQLRNKISARNFRVRRKEYITQLEEKVEEHEKTIEGLKVENSKLRAANEEIMKQLLNQPITPPSSSEEVFSSESSSGSEGHNSPEAAPISSMFQFQFNDLYDLNLFDQQQPQQSQQQELLDANNLFYLNHAIMPDWDIHQVLGEKGRPITSEESQRQASRDLIYDYPLLAPALMSIVLRHTLSLEYVTSLAKEFSDSIGADLTGDNVKPPAYEDSDVKPRKRLAIREAQIANTEEAEEKAEEEDTEEKLSDDEVAQRMLNDCFPTYVLMRARGFSHEEIVERCRVCINDKNSKCNIKRAKKEARRKAKEEQSFKQNKSKISALQTYCRVAGTLLKHPNRMTHVNKVLKEEIEFTHNKHTARIESNYASLISPFKNLRIAGSSK